MHLLARIALLLSLMFTMTSVVANVAKNNSSVAQPKRKLRPERPPDDIMKAKCGFTLNEIHECKIKGCNAATSECSNANVSFSDCLFDKCHDARIECEKPLNNHLSPEEICEGDGFTKVDNECLKTKSASKDLLEACKAEKYVKVRRECFEPVWKKRIHDVGMNNFNVLYMTNEFIDCAYIKCFENTEECIKKHHEEMAKNPRIYTEFSLEHCAYVSNVYPRDCETPNCTTTMEECYGLYPTPKSMIPIFAVAGVAGLLVIGLTIFTILKLRRRKDEGFVPVAKC
ncbi:uncharacterized protein LOC133347830 [Lethenteron reissneri]|uniref:uncharacterized protein LOC133347830 n=1 Tax=Lethenteron reissneri TaxID=7753 RepID=UPI002AB74CF9|nr:uncharacterized protein LOC133347830 [Lethenteron reissneri]